MPLLCVFAGFPTQRMFARWRPTGPGPMRIIRVDDRDPGAVLRRTVDAFDELLALSESTP